MVNGFRECCVKIFFLVSKKAIFYSFTSISLFWSTQKQSPYLFFIREPNFKSMTVQASTEQAHENEQLK